MSNVDLASTKQLPVAQTAKHTSAKQTMMIPKENITFQSPEQPKPNLPAKVRTNASPSKKKKK